VTDFLHDLNNQSIFVYSAKNRPKEKQVFLLPYVQRAYACVYMYVYMRVFELVRVYMCVSVCVSSSTSTWKCWCTRTSAKYPLHFLSLTKRTNINICTIAWCRKRHHLSVLSIYNLFYRKLSTCKHFIGCTFIFHNNGKIPTHHFQRDSLCLQR